VLARILNRFLFLGFVLRVRSFVRQAGPDIVQVNPAALQWVGLLPFMMPRQTCFIYNEKQLNLGMRRGWRGRLKDWQLLAVTWVNARLLFDHACFDHAWTAKRVLGDRWPDRATAIPVGVDPSFLSLAPAHRAAGGTEHPVRYIYVGALTKFRELERLLLAVREVLARTSNFCVGFVGPDKANGFYQNLVDELGLQDVVSISPPVPYSQIPELMASFDVGLAYVPDFLGHLQPAIKILEYRALGLPIISTDVASHREIVEDGINGLLVDNSTTAWAGAMRRFIEDRQFLQRCGEQASAMRRGMTWDEVARAHEQVYYKLKNLPVET
jgi:glycosyltransferase involved in cell wall biosynthesis